jgi:MGT family glycosyltransferase
VSFGTLLGHMSIAAEAYDSVLEAVAGLDARVLLTVGHRFDTSRLTRIPRNVHVEPWVDQADALAHADLVVSHGGSGTTFGALAAGVPLVVVPLFADQFANGETVAGRGAGVVVETGRPRDGRQPTLLREDAPGITRAIQTVRADPSYGEQARRVADEMATAPTAGALVTSLLSARRANRS